MTTSTSSKLYSFDDFPEHKAFLPQYAEKWTKNALNTAPMTDEDRVISKQAILDMYNLAKCAKPKVLFCAGPLSAVFAAAFLDAFIDADKKPERLQFTGHKSTDAVISVLGQFFDIVPSVATAQPYTRNLKRWVTQDGSFKALAAEFGAIGKAALERVTQIRNDYFQAGQQSSDYCSFYEFFQEVAKLPIDWTGFEIYKTLAKHSGERYVAEQFCIVCDRPTLLKQDEQNRPHAENGPFCEWADGFKTYAWHGTYIPAEFIECKDTIDESLALNHPQIEQRRALSEILGWGRVLTKVNAKVIDKDVDPEIGELIEVNLPDLGTQRFIRVLCGTGRTFCLPVPPDQQTALEANAWTYGISADDLKLKEFRT